MDSKQPSKMAEKGAKVIDLIFLLNIFFCVKSKLL